MNNIIKIGTRNSKLAMIQSEIIGNYIKKQGLNCQYVSMVTTGDIVLDKPLWQVGGKGLFVKELDKALIENKTQLSVHSLKDMPMEISSDLPIVAFSKREDPRDVLILPKGKNKIDFTLPIGCSSKRRIIQLKEVYKNAGFKSIRGNLQTRLNKLDNGEYGAIVLAAAGIKRLGLESRISRYFSIDEIIPAGGQGIIAVQGNLMNDYSYLSDFNNIESQYIALAERSFVNFFNGGCQMAIGVYGEIKDNRLFLKGMYSFDNKTIIKGEVTGNIEEAKLLGVTLGKQIMERGEIL